MGVKKTKKYEVFKECSSCKKKWTRRKHFLDDPDLEIIGYQADFRELTEGLFLFNHSCGTTIAIKAQYFVDLYDGPIFQDKMLGSDACEGFCEVRDNLLSCSNKCECAYVRETIQIVKNWPKNHIK